MNKRKVGNVLGITSIMLIVNRSYVKNLYLGNTLFELIEKKLIHKEIEIDLTEICHSPSKVFNQLNLILKKQPKSE